jgi:hypothetical protein
VLDAIFRLLFSYRPVVFQQGEFRFAPTTGSYVAAAVVLVVLAITVLTYRSSRAKPATRQRVVLMGVRLVTLVLVLFCLFRPVLIIKAAVPSRTSWAS